MSMSKVFMAVALFLAAPAFAQDALPPQLMFPAGCTLGQDCWVVNYADMDEAAGKAEDFRCGRQTYDEHEGTDFAVRDMVTMVTGVSVLAAAEGKVLRVRDDVEDSMPGDDDMEKMKAEKKGCGNGVYIDHGNGWQTIYCHMKKGSIVVKPGQDVRTGEAIGQIGQSGIAEFPHLHFSVFHNGKTIEPFSGQPVGAGCEASAAEEPLWREELAMAYAPFSLYAGGFAGHVPDFEQIKIDAAGTDGLNLGEMEALSFWIALYGVAEGDKIRLEIKDEAGTTIASRDIVQDKTRARQFYFIGKKAGPAIKPGTYTGMATLIREHDAEPLTGNFSATVAVAP